MKIGIIGAGEIAQAFAHQAVNAGYSVVLSNSRGPETLASVVRNLGPRAGAGTVAEAAQETIVVLAVPWKSVPGALSGLPAWNNRIVIDATNPIEPPDFKMADLGGKVSSEVVAEQLPGARVVKAFNTLPTTLLRADPREAGGRRVIFMSGDEATSKQEVGRMIDKMGFAVIDVGSLATGGRLQQFPGGPLPTLNLIQLR